MSDTSNLLSAPRAESRTLVTPRARIEGLLDPGTCAPLTPVGDPFQAEPVGGGPGMVAAVGTIEGTTIVVFASDASIQGGAIGEQGCGVVVHAYDKALSLGCPVIGLWHSGGARLREGVSSLHGVGQVFAIMTRASGSIPQISVILGPAAGGAAYGPALTDVVILGPSARVFVTGPDVVRSVTGEATDALNLGGPEAHARRSGVAHLVCGSEDEAYAQARRVTTLLGAQGVLTVPAVTDRDLGRLLPESARRAYDVHPVVDGLLDEPGLELQPRWAPNIVTTLGRLGGRTVGVLANNPLRLGGCLDSASAEKASRFVRMCDAFGIPLVVVVDVPGYLPGVKQEWGGVVRRGAKLLHAFADAEVPRVTLITRKSYGGAYIAMNSRSLGATRVLAWPTAEVAVMGTAAAVRLLYRRRLVEVPAELRPQVERELAAEHANAVGGLDRAVGIGVVDEVIEPSATRVAVARAIAAAPQVRGRHKNIPL